MLIIVGKIVIDTIPGMRQEISWTLVNLLYLGVSEPMLAIVPLDAHVPLVRSPSFHISCSTTSAVYPLTLTLVPTTI